VLVEEGILDPAKLERALNTAPSKTTVRSAELLKHLDLELWARRWYAKN
jgi:hypothetical protein